MFELKIGDEIKNLKWGTYAMKLWCDLTGKTVDVFFVALNEMASSVSQQAAFQMTIEIIQAGYECANKEKVSEETVCDWIDQLGGIANVNNTSLVGYINYVVKLTLTGVTPLPGDTSEDKKKEE